jgi:hypothetical protein
MREEAVHSPTDPLGYYAKLGIGPLADTQEIKAAYRQKAKLSHPDINLHEDAEKDFIDLTTAYTVLKNTKSRARYDATARSPGLAGLIDPQDPNPKPLHCSRCGKITAQPRYIVFHRVKTFLLFCHHGTIKGIFCRDCADRTAIRASTITWLLGWWGPYGPLRTLKALLCNLRGGDLPRADNLWVLLHQARAFLADGDNDIARALAAQAQAFAKNNEDRASIAAIVRAAGPSSTPITRRLKNRWRPWNYTSVMQALPLAGLSLAILVGISALVFRSQTESVSAMITIRPAQAGEVRHVAIDVLKVRQGPTNDHPVLALLDRFSTVQVMDSVADGEWARILTPTGVTGYVPSRYLFGGSGDELKNRWCSDQKGTAPHTGDILLRRTGGEHRIAVKNTTGKDVVVRLGPQNGRTLIAFFMAKGEETVVNGIPDGTFRAIFSTGRNFSRACATFLNDMQTFVAPVTQTLSVSSRNALLQNATLTLPPPGDAPGQSRPLAMEDLPDN